MINQTGPSFREVTLVEYQTVTAKATGTTKFLEPLCPLGVQLTIWFLILRLKDPYNFLWRERARDITEDRIPEEGSRGETKLKETSVNIHESKRPLKIENCLHSLKARRFDIDTIKVLCRI